MEALWIGFYVALILFGGGFLAIQLLMGQLNHLGHDHGLFEAHDHDIGQFDAHAADGIGIDSSGFDHGGGAHDGVHHDGEGGDHGDDMRLSFLTPLVITPAMASAGATGLVFSLLLHLPVLIHAAAAFLIGAFVHVTVRTILTRMMGMQGSSEVRVDRLWGTLAEVTTPIPVNKLGEIRYVANGAYHTSPARSTVDEVLPRGALVMIERIENSVAFVRPSTV